MRETIVAWVIMLWLLAIGLGLYLVPVLIATARRHHNRFAIIALNVFLGWTFVGWVIALVWSLTEVRSSPPVTSPPPHH